MLVFRTPRIFTDSRLEPSRRESLFFMPHSHYVQEEVSCPIPRSPLN